MLNNCTHAAANLIARDTCYASLMPNTSDLASIGAYFVAAVLGTAYLAHLGRKYFF